MQADTQSISIEASPARVFQIVADPRNLPRWAVGFARSVRQENGRWYVQTGGGEVPLRMETDATRGIVDFWLSVAPGREILAASRVVARGPASEYTFTQFRAPDMPAEAFAKNVSAVRHVLRVLKAVAEVECPL